jgi:hypothetical protein
MYSSVLQNHHVNSAFVDILCNTPSTFVVHNHIRFMLIVLFLFSFFRRYAGAVFADACLKGLNGVPDIVECSFVQSTVTELPFFASKVLNV